MYEIKIYWDDADGGNAVIISEENRSTALAIGRQIIREGLDHPYNWGHLMIPVHRITEVRVVGKPPSQGKGLKK